MRLRVLLLGVVAMALMVPASASAGRRSHIDWSQYIDKDAGKRRPSGTSTSKTTASKTKSKAKAKRAKKKRHKRRVKARTKRVRGKKRKR